MGKVPVCLRRDGNGAGRWDAISLTGWDGATRFLGGTGRNGTGNDSRSGLGREHSRQSGRERQSGMVGNTTGNAAVYNG